MNENCHVVVLNSLTLPGTDLQPIAPKLWSSGFLFERISGVASVPRRAGAYLGDPQGMTRETRRAPSTL